ncbi:hypothetical protein I552_4249 [Mycobacterium xenopi 3993]|nr:hypothetical protein I552_4249 [Mycobacterium xenopi 3993]
MAFIKPHRAQRVPLAALAVANTSSPNAAPTAPRPCPPTRAA